MSHEEDKERPANAVIVRPGDVLDRVLRIFKKQVEKAGIISDIRRKSHYEKPSIRAKKKSIAARKRKARLERKAQGE